ncbi:cytochrome P460 [Thiogranum longum]|uniref:Cytochrome P460 n=1 Tax=Thiogranum longum TaxID=1537524 RepID=A0A4R1HEE9_9GAMM|nr:cytochrome P460 family protein [Thiogranum longum]TCK19023.1 cytochrome P460 [Thiogranum longum]
MKKINVLLLTSSLAFSLASVADDKSVIPPAPNGIEFPADYPNWRVISISHRTDNNSMRTILGNDIAIEAARAGNTNPWPDGAVLGKVVWKQTAKKHWPSAIAPDKFVHAEFMFRDSKKWAGNGTGWGWARWVGTQQKPYGKDAGFSQECISCHTPVKGNDWVFTTPAMFPTVFK